MNTEQLSKVFGPNSGLIEEKLSDFLQNPASVEVQWQDFFRSNEDLLLNQGVAVSSSHDSRAELCLIAQRLLSSYRRYGHLAADISIISANDLVRMQPDFSVGTGEAQSDQAETEVNQNFGLQTLSQLRNRLEQIYCSGTGFEFEQVSNYAERDWLYAQIETDRGQANLSAEQISSFYQDLLAAELFEDTLQKNFIGQKRFSLEGGEALIPLLKVICSRSLSADYQEIIFGMAHRGRLNVLHNIMEKPLANIFAEFKDQTACREEGAGDVKYHLGFETSKQDQLDLRLAPNPSHLEFVYPVILGMAKAQAERRDCGRQKVMPVAIHGDAAFIGQGVVTEALNFTDVPGYKSGGTLHIVINNQIGFTTTASEARSAQYCTAFAKGQELPIMHVNADDLGAVNQAANLAFDYRNKFGKDVVIDLYCYRQYGHNEADDPSYTQPKMYEQIKSLDKPSKRFLQRLNKSGARVPAETELAEINALVEARFAVPEEQAIKNVTEYSCVSVNEQAKTKPQAPGIDELIQALADAVKTREGQQLYNKLEKILQRRVVLAEEQAQVDWGAAEYLAFASVLAAGFDLRLSGQDVGRGTFSHRHLIANDPETGEEFSIMDEVLKRNPDVRLEVYNSVLSEAAVLGFEFGYKSLKPAGLVIWEAQFGDFANGAQVIIDQFVSSSLVKWQQNSGLTLFLPHGYEGQGPEHSSARLERFLQLSADNNMHVVYPTTAAQIYHLIRRQAFARTQKPLVVMTPKSLLRADSAYSDLESLSEGEFMPVLCENIKPGDKPRVIMTCGKIYYDLVALAQEHSLKNLQICRLEELYPFPAGKIKKLCVEGIPAEALWVQDEPKNMGAYYYAKEQLMAYGCKKLSYAGRAASATPATGSPAYHQKELAMIKKNVLDWINQ